MDGNNWRAAQGQVQIPGQVIGGEGGDAGGMEGVEWRTLLQPESRQRIVNKIMETLKRHLPLSGSGPDGLQELKKIAVRFEEKIYSAATSQSDYLRKISLKMLTMETRSQNPTANSLQSSAASTSKNSQEIASQNMSQIQNQVQQQAVPMISNQSQVRQQLISQNIQSNIASNGVPNSAGLSSSLPPIGGITQSSMSTVPGQNLNIQSIPSMSNLTSNTMGNPMGQGVSSNVFVNSQRQILGRQSQGATQEQQQQSQNSQQYLYNHQIQQQLMKQKLQQGGVPPQSIMQTQVQQQQNLLQPNQLQSSQQAVMQSSLRQTSSSSTLQNQQSSLQQSTQSIMQQQSQSVLRQQQQQQQPQSSVMHQQQNSMPQHPILSSQQQQQLSGQQPNTVNMQQNQLISQQSSILDAQSQHQQHQRMIIQQNNISNMQQQQQQTVSLQNNIPSLHSQQLTSQQNNLANAHQQQLGAQANLSGFQQQQMVGIQHGNSSLQANQQPVHMLQQSKVTSQNQLQQNMTNILPNQSQQQQSQPMQQHLISQMQPQSAQLHQQLGLQPQANSLSRDMQQRIQNSGPVQPQTTIDQQKQMPQPQRAISEVQIDSSSPSGNVGSGDWQEEIYQKIKSMHEMYYHDLNEMCQRMAIKLQQHDAVPQQQKNDQLEKFNFFKGMLDKLLAFLRVNKKDIQISHKERLVGVEKQIVNILNSNRPRRSVSSLQKGQLTQTHMLSVQPSQQQPQISHMHTNEGQMNSQMQTLNVQGSVMAPQQNNLSNLQNNILSSVSGVPNARPNMMDALKPSSSVDPGQGNGLNQMQQVTVNSLQQNPVSVPQQMNPNSMSSQTGLTTLASGVNPLQPNSTMFQTHQIKQEQQMFSNQQLKQQYQQRQIQQQYMQRQQMMQQQQQLQTTQQPLSQLPVQQMTQLNQMTDANDVRMRHQMGGKPGILQTHSSSGQRSSYHHQQMKSGGQFSISSQQVLQVGSPQIGHHSSPQLDQQNLLSHTKVGTPLQSANSPFIVPSPSTSMAPSPMPGDTEKITSGISSLSNVGNVVNHPPTAASNIPNQSLAIGTPGISASPLLAEFTSPDGTQGVASNIVSGNSNVAEQPLDRLIKAVKSMSPRSLSASISDISSVVSLVDRIAGSAPGNGSRAAVGEDLVAMTKCRLQARNFFVQDGPSGTKKMRRYTTAMTSNVVSTGSVNDSIRHLSGNESDADSTGATCIERPEVNHELLEELREINQRLIDTVVHVSDDVDLAGASGVGEGTVVKCSFSAIALSPNLKSQYASAQMSPIQPLRLLIPKDYPNSSPVLLDKFPIEASKEYEDLSIKAKSRFSISLRTLSQPMSLGDIARTWDKCARAVLIEYAQMCGGGTFSSKYGTWENCLRAA